MPRESPRFRDSWLLRIGTMLIGLILVGWAGLWLANRVWDFNPDVGPAGMWSILWILLGLVFVIVGVGQTLLRRRKSRHEQILENKRPVGLS